MADPATSESRHRLPEVFRRRVRARIAELFLTHEAVAGRLERAAPIILGAEEPMRTSPRKVGNVVAGNVHPKFPEIEVWAAALETSEAYLLGFTWDPRPERPIPAGIVDSDTPGLLKEHDAGRSGYASPVIRIEGVRGGDPRPPRDPSLFQRRRVPERAEGEADGRSVRMAPVANLAARRLQRRGLHGSDVHGEPAPIPG